jgi:hypothetical protein
MQKKTERVRTTEEIFYIFINYYNEKQRKNSPDEN